MKREREREGGGRIVTMKGDSEREREQDCHNEHVQRGNISQSFNGNLLMYFMPLEKGYTGSLPRYRSYTVLVEQSCFEYLREIERERERE